jgi:uncharacterized protein YajQ (UPF0234 family)
MQIKIHINGNEEATLVSSDSDEIQSLFEILREHLNDVKISIIELDHDNMKSRILFSNKRSWSQKITV